MPTRPAGASSRDAVIKGCSGSAQVSSRPPLTRTPEEILTTFQQAVTEEVGDESTSGPEVLRGCSRAACCPVCGKPNRCRMETGEPYKGPCWCFGPTLSGAALHRILADLPEPRCLCQHCLEAIAANPGIAWDELAARRQPVTPPPALLEGDTYQEGAAIVFTAQFHLRRGYCCGNGCRHCPY